MRAAGTARGIVLVKVRCCVGLVGFEQRAGWQEGGVPLTLLLPETASVDLPVSAPVTHLFHAHAQGGDALPVYATDGEILFRQDAYMHYLFGVMEEGFWGAVDTRDVSAAVRGASGLGRLQRLDLN